MSVSVQMEMRKNLVLSSVPNSTSHPLSWTKEGDRHSPGGGSPAYAGSEILLPGRKTTQYHGEHTGNRARVRTQAFCKG